MTEACGEEKLREAMERWGTSVYRLAFAQTGSRSDAEDIYQEVFLRYWRAPPDADSDEHTKAWLLRVTVNCAHSLYRSKKRRAVVELTDELSDQSGSGELDAVWLRELINSLPEAYRSVICLYYVEGFSTAQIAGILGRGEGTVRMQLTRARRMLRNEMEVYS